MKIRFTVVILTLSFMITGGVAAANAQIDSDSVFTISVPFPFNVRGKNFAAGKYVIRTPETSANNGAMEITAAKGKAASLFETIPIGVSDGPKESNVIFGKVQGKYFLSEIWEANNASGAQVEEPDMKDLERSGITKEKEVVHAEMSRRHMAMKPKHTY